MVDYESRSSDDQAVTAGGRLAVSAANDRLVAGVTAIREGTPGADGELAGVDLTLRLNDATEARVKEHVKRMRAAKAMRVTSSAGSDLTISLQGAVVGGNWGATIRPGTLTHWPGGLVLAFPAAGSVNGRLVLARRAGFKIAEVAVTWRNDEQSRVSLGRGLAAFVDLFRLRFRR